MFLFSNNSSNSRSGILFSKRLGKIKSKKLCQIVKGARLKDLDADYTPLPIHTVGTEGAMAKGPNLDLEGPYLVQAQCPI